ncbi:MAG: transcription-repair coupling factor [Clostridiales bacterium]|jgi:transcription-repair coupling factor (superfamily II helicase)|nr:transcription-repair coupling factor [Clostridiales bacterium]
MLKNILKNSASFKAIIEHVTKRETPVTVKGLTDAAFAHMLSCLPNMPTIVLTPSIKTAKQLCSDLQLFTLRPIHFLAPKELILYNVDARAADITRERLRVMNEAVTNPNQIFILPVEAAIQSVMPRSLFADDSLILKKGHTYELDFLVDRFVNLGYVREHVVEGEGQFSVRGGILDFSSVSGNFRVDFFGDEIENIRTFDIGTQRSLENRETAVVLPVQEKDAQSDFTIFLDYFKDAAVFMQEPLACGEAARMATAQLESEIKFAESGGRKISSSDILKDFGDVVERAQGLGLIGVCGISTSNPYFRSKKIIEMTAIRQPGFQGNMELFIDTVRGYVKSKRKVYVVAGSETKAKNIVETLCERGLFALYNDDGKDAVTVAVGEIREGFEYPEVNTAVISDRDIFGAVKKGRKGASGGKFRGDNVTAAQRLQSYSDLETGDYVVHQNHGIGKYLGIKQITVSGARMDYLQIKYHGEDKLYIPVNQLDMIYKYVGKDGVQVRLSRLGGAEWNRTKQRVKRACEDMAEQLVELYAKRQMQAGRAFPADDQWQSEFEETFEYNETEDQLRTIEEVKRDMQAPRPMDRLVCGDVGYGKTEVAMRAAFKAVISGAQVAYLVPTTVLASQHFAVFRRRMQQFGVRIELLSRFRKPAEQKATIARLEKGEADIVIGTHRLLQKDIKYKNLGLLIIDEEQRFGVSHKERIKEIKTNIDVLTLTATPIPRTLHMSLSGIRDMSVIETPPKNRYPVATYVLEYNFKIVREAIAREVARGGQVYYLHNRVETIHGTADKIRKISPNLRVSVAHGQMAEASLERIMVKVAEGEVDVLICTTIIETGLDIPNINTIIIENADRMGLAQLYQLRGRVGRSNRLAHAYLTYNRDKILTEQAGRRLKAIQEFTEFGSGFKIALRDLEIRGAGNVIGSQQHGHMDAVGYDLYCQFLEEAITKIKGEPERGRTEDLTTINVPCDAYLPESYIEGENYRIEMYKKIAGIRTDEDYSYVEQELLDRYGEISQCVRNLLDVAILKALASDLHIVEIKQFDGFFLMKMQRGFGESFRIKTDDLGKDGNIKFLLQRVKALKNFVK